MTERPPEQPFADLQWHALTLAERLAGKNLISHVRSSRHKDRVRRIRWRAERRADLAHVREPTASSFPTPPWLQTFRLAYANAERPLSNRPDGFLTAIEPVLANARCQIHAVLRESASGAFPTSKEAQVALVASFERSLRGRLFAALSKTLVLELAVAGRHKILAGNSSQERFAFFCHCLEKPDFARALLEQYPVLVRRTVTLIANWQTGTLALLSRLARSHHALCGKFFNGSDPGPILAVETSGDAHCNGQAVHILTFENGQRLVYKPRSVAMESCFFNLLGWLNRRGCEPNLKEVGTFDEGPFGWMEFVEAKPCQTTDQVERFFFRQGAQIALLYILGGADLHHENVIAHGEHPVLVDLETLFQTPLLPNELTGATELGWRALRTSIMGTLLLPEPIFLAKDQNWVDLSALGNTEGQLSPLRVPLWRGYGTDQMRLLHQRIPMKRGTSLPEHHNSRIPVAAHADVVVNGITYMYDFLRKQQDTLLSEVGPLTCFLGKPARHVFRATAWYEQILSASYHPRFQLDAIALEAFLYNRLRAEADGAPWLSAVEDTEVASLFAGDIPYFVSAVGQRLCPIQNEIGGFANSGNGWEQCRTRIEAMSDADLDRQTWLARVAMADRSIPAAAARPETRAPRDATSGALISTAIRIGERICDSAIADGERASWLIPVFADTNRLTTTVAGCDLYNGLPGIALFLGYLGSITGESRFRRVAITAISEALALYEAADPRESSCGAFEVGGLAYVLMQLATALGHPEWVGDATKMLHQIARRSRNSTELDIISGQAGLIIAALAVHRHTNDAALIRRLRPVAQKLRHLATIPTKRAESLLPTKADAGLAHGRAGIGFALSRWAEATGEDGFHEAADDLINFDLAAIDASYLESSSLLPFQLGWCRGWLGIALCLLQTNRTLKSIKPSDTVHFQRIADHIIKFGVDGPLCLCHGALGHLEFLETAMKRGVINNVEASEAWRRRLFTRLLSGEWVADNTHQLESPSLMVGLAGTGYALLRAAHPERVPSVLTIEPPSVEVASGWTAGRCRA